MLEPSSSAATGPTLGCGRTGLTGGQAAGASSGTGATSSTGTRRPILEAVDPHPAPLAQRASHEAAITKAAAERARRARGDLAEDPHVQFWCSEASCHSSGWKSRQYWLMESTAILSGPDCPLADRAARRLELS